MLQNIFCSIKTMYMMSIGWLTHPADYERYHMAWKLTREHRDWVDAVLLAPSASN